MKYRYGEYVVMYDTRNGKVLDMFHSSSHCWTGIPSNTFNEHIKTLYGNGVQYQRLKNVRANKGLPT